MTDGAAPAESAESSIGGEPDIVPLYPGSIRIRLPQGTINPAVPIKAIESLQGGDSLVKGICAVQQVKDSLIVLFQNNDSGAANLIGKTLQLGGHSVTIADGSLPENIEASSKSIDDSKAVPRVNWRTTVTFRVAGLPLIVNPNELLIGFNDIGFALSSISSLSQVYCTDVYLRSLKIRSEIVEIRQDCLKSEAEKFQALAGHRQIVLGGKTLKIRLFRPGHCFSCQKRGHNARDCPEAAKMKEERLAQQVCWSCHKPGHSRKRCPVRLEKQAAWTARQAEYAVAFSPACPIVVEEGEFADNSTISQAAFPPLCASPTSAAVSAIPPAEKGSLFTHPVAKPVWPPSNPSQSTASPSIKRTTANISPSLQSESLKVKKKKKGASRKDQSSEEQSALDGIPKVNIPSVSTIDSVIDDVVASTCPNTKVTPVVTGQGGVNESPEDMVQ